MATLENNIKKGQYLKKTGADSYVHYHFDTDDSIVYLIDKLDKIQGGGEVDSSHYAKGTTLHETLCALYTLASKGGQASTDLANLTNNVNKHIQNVNNPHSVNKKQVGLGNVINAAMDDAPIAGSNNYVKSGGVYDAVKNVSDKADQAISIANGQSHAYVFADVAGLRSGTLSSNQPISGYKVGDSIYIIAPDVSDFWISGGSSNGTASNANVINSAKKGNTVIVKWGSSYVSLTALESKRDLSGYATTSALNSALGNFYDKGTADGKYVPYSGAKKDVNLGDHSLRVGDTTLINPVYTEISKGQIALSGRTLVGPSVIGRAVDITVNGISVDNTRFNYPDDTTSGTLATQEFVAGRYQTSDQVNSLINQTRLTFSGDVSGTGVINDPDISLYLNNQAKLPDDDDKRTFSAVHVNKQGIVTEAGQQIVFAPNLEDPHLKNLVIGGVAIIDA